MPSTLVHTILLCLLSNGVAEFQDELTVYEKECLGEDKFHCGQSQCIWLMQHCDGTVDCDNGADETFCVIHIQNGTCKPDQFTCADGKQCIPAIWECNNITNCDDRSDELNCTALPVSHNGTCGGFTCGDGRCVSPLWACDGVYDCADKSDEMPAACKHSHFLSYEPSHCSTPIHSRGDVPKECEDKSYCLPEAMFCDGMKDCKDGSDEGAFCLHWQKMCVNHSCGNDTKAFCAPDPKGPKCYCENAATYNTSSKLCETIDMCQEARPYCGHKCEYLNGPMQFNCSCEDGYSMDKLGIGHACFAPDPEAFLLFSTSNTVGYIKLRSKQKVILVHTKEARGVASDGSHVFWVETSEGHEAIAKAKLNDIGSKTVLVGLGLEDPSEIAVDWQGGHIYFSDAERGVISVCKTNGNMCTTLNTDARVPKFVTLDPKNGKMYWSDWHSGPVIQSSDMAGRRASPLNVSLNASPTGLALDVPAQRLYYVDGTVRGINLNNMKVFTLFDEQIYHPYALSVFENTVYWSDWASSTIQACDKATGQPTDQIYKFDSSVMGMHIYHPIVTQSRYNPCADDANCSHFCFVTSNQTYMCGCPDGYILENKQCTHKIKDYRQTYLVVGGGARFTRIQYNAFGGPESEATTFDIGRVQAMTYDSHRDTLYIYDGERKTINSVSMSNFTFGHATMVIYKGLHNVVDMDYDYVTDSLYILDAGHNHKRIEVVSLRTMKHALVYRFIDETPISFCLLPDYGNMLIAVSETDNDVIHIDSFGLDGSDRHHVVMNDLKGPHISLRYSRNLDIVYIADEGNHIIETMHPEGTARETYKELSRTVISLAVTDNLVQWSGRSSSRLYWADAHEASPRIRRVELASFPNTTYLHLQSTYPAPINFSHPCNEKKCSDICVQTPRGKNGSLKGKNGSLAYKCLCPAGLLDLDGICIEAVSCKEYEAHCHLSNMCVPKRQLCDGKHDCSHGEDEDDCPAPPPLKNMSICGVNEVECNSHCIRKDKVCNTIALSIPTTCTSAEFQCVMDGLCIERSQMCNGVPDCTDWSDESKHLCTTLTCLHTEFLCSSGACILNSLRCDGEEDCSDGSDELNCARKTCPTGYFQCRNSECVEMKKRCDHHSDCTDYSDEEDCIADDIVDNQEPVEACAAWEHTCELNSTVCIPLTARCNGKVDCPGSTDESNCNDHCAPKGLFECKLEGHCLTRDKLCNGKKDCTDGSDETPMVCSRVNRTSRVYTIHYFPAYECRSGYTCDSGQCIEWRDVCDHQPNCFDGSDESPLCFTACENHTCSQKCQPTPKGPTCQCPSGFEFSSDRKTCRDIDECVNTVNEPCSQRCINIAGSFLCACYRGYALRTDRRSCKAVRDHMAVLYVTGNSVRSLTADGLPAVEFNDPNVSSVTDIDCDVRRRKLYVTSADASKLIEVNSTKNQVTVTNVGTPTKVAVEWISGNVYFVDSALPDNYIRVCNVERKRCARLQRLPAQSITTSLVIDPASRLMFYCITREQESIIWSATLGGFKVRDIATVHNCTGLAVDSFKRRLYVAQTGPASVIRMDFNGGGLTKILQNDIHLDAPHGLAIFEDHVYYLVANSFKLNRCLLYGERNCEVYLQRIFNANTFVIRHESTQPDELHICDAYKCDNICVMDAGGPVCLCHNGSVANDGSCPLLGKDQLPLFNGWTTQEYATSGHVYRTLMISVLVILALYLIAFGYYRCFYKKRAQTNDNYVPVHFTNSLSDFDGCSPFPSPLTPQVAIGSGEFLNPFIFMRDAWRSSHRMPSKSAGAAGMKIDIPEFAAGPAKIDVSDTESDIDEKENGIITIRRK